MKNEIFFVFLVFLFLQDKIYTRHVIQHKKRIVEKVTITNIINKKNSTTHFEYI
jgi:hypothetical protein